MVRTPTVRRVGHPAAFPQRAQPPISESLRQILSTFESDHAREVIYVGGRNVETRGLPKKRVLDQLENTLYELLHAGRSVQLGPPVSDLGFVNEIRSSHRVAFTADPGWRITAATSEKDQYVVEKDGLQLWVGRERHVIGEENPQVGGLVALRLPPDRPNYSPGFFAIVSGAGWPESDAIGRFYCNLKSTAIREFLRRVTEVLEPLGTKYLIKTPNRPEYHGRRDGTVLYVGAADEGVVGETLGRVMTDLDGGVNPETPALALALGSGLSFAQEPPQQGGQPLSFGQHRCRVLAETFWLAHKRRYTGPAELVRLASKKLLEARIDPLRPYRNMEERRSGSARGADYGETEAAAGTEATEKGLD